MLNFRKTSHISVLDLAHSVSTGDGQVKELTQKGVIFITTLGLEWLKHREQSRHNLAGEAETYRTNVANEGIKKDANVETRRSNLSNERIRREANAEAARSNRANEAIKRDQLEESHLQHAADLSLKRDIENREAKYARLEHERKDRADIWQHAIDSSTAESNIKLNKAKINEIAGKLEETARHNRATEEADEYRNLAAIFRALGSDQGTGTKLGVIMRLVYDMGLNDDGALDDFMTADAIQGAVYSGSKAAEGLAGIFDKLIASRLGKKDIGDGTTVTKRIEEIFDADGKSKGTKKIIEKRKPS